VDSDTAAVSIALGHCLSSRSLSPALIVARGDEASEMFLQFAGWLYEHPYILDHQGWDAFLQNRDGDFSGNWDYKGRNHSNQPDDGLELSFAPAESSGSAKTVRKRRRYAVLGHEFASGDGLVVAPNALVTFHFWGAAEKQHELFNIFYPFEGVGFAPAARAVLSQYMRQPFSGSPASVEARSRDTAHLTAITYADGCCEKSRERNRQTALEVGVDEARAYGRKEIAHHKDLDAEWAERHADILNQKKGGGWWLWKPAMILKTLQDDAVPWHTGVVLWLDAGNFYVGDPQPVVARALNNSDVAAMRLKCCTESDWTSAKALKLLGGDVYSIADLPQLGAYFLMFRKTTTAMAFVEDWLRYSEDPDILMESGGTSNMEGAPGYQRHMADQSIFSVLFKQRGFEAMSLEDGHKAVQLDRWRE